MIRDLGFPRRCRRVRRLGCVALPESALEKKTKLVGMEMNKSWGFSKMFGLRGMKEMRAAKGWALGEVGGDDNFELEGLEESPTCSTR